MLLYVYNEAIDQVIACQAYSTKNHFVTTKCLAIEKNERLWYVPLDYISDEYDSSLRTNIAQGDYQICTSLPINVINKYMPGGNLLIPLTSYEILYKLLVGLFGTFHVTLSSEGVLFRAPSQYAGLTKIFVNGLNVTITLNDTTWSTAYNGISDKITRNDNLKSRCMVVKLIAGAEYLISFTDSFKTFQYEQELVKNFMIIGYDVEHCQEQNGSYRRLIVTDEYYLYNAQEHKIHKIGQFAEQIRYINFVKNFYMRKNKCVYNYYVLRAPLYVKENDIS